MKLHLANVSDQDIVLPAPLPTVPANSSVEFIITPENFSQLPEEYKETIRTRAEFELLRVTVEIEPQDNIAGFDLSGEVQVEIGVGDEPPAPPVEDHNMTIPPLVLTTSGGLVYDSQGRILLRAS